MYKDSLTAVRCAVETTDSFGVEVGLHQGFALSPFLFAMVMDRLTDDIKQEAPLYHDVRGRYCHLQCA